MSKFFPFFVLAICATVFQSVLAGDDWWEYGHFYQVYPRSFQDSDGDGVGDINGITMRLPYLKEIGVTGIWLSPVFKSPMLDFGYDISDFRAIDPQFGTMADFHNMVKRCKELDIKIILDFVPNHTSDQHEWFANAINKSHPEHEKYKNYFIWHEGKLLENGTRVPPSNWLSIFRGSAWQWVDTIQAYFLHQFLPEQPDLNFRNEDVINEMKEILRFWLRDGGVDGFRVDAIPHLVESDVNEHGQYVDEPQSGECLDDPLASCYLHHTETKDLHETFEMVYQWRKVMEEPEFKSHTRIIMTEAYSDTLELLMKYYGRSENGQIVEYGAQIPFNFNLIESSIWTPATEFERLIKEFVDRLPKGEKIHANWVMGNHDKQRIASRFSPLQVDIFNILSKTLPGITVTYYGEEIGMSNVFISWEDTVDPQACNTNPKDYYHHSRDKVRTPFQWDNTTHSGFSTAKKTWLPMAQNYSDCNVALQNSADRSHLKVFRQLINLRQNPTLKYGGLEIKAVGDRMLVYKRQIDNQHDADIFVIVLNLDTSYKHVDLNYYLHNLPQKLEVVISSIHSTSLINGTIVEAHNINMPPETGVVFVGNYT